MNDQQRESARETMRCYNSMETTKRRHIELLTMLDNKKKRFNLDPTGEETQLLSDLLRDHDQEVSAFATASAALKRQDPAAHTALFEYIGKVAGAMSDAETRVEH